MGRRLAQARRCAKTLNTCGSVRGGGSMMNIHVLHVRRWGHPKKIGPLKMTRPGPGGAHFKVSRLGLKGGGGPGAIHKRPLSRSALDPENVTLPCSRHPDVFVCGLFVLMQVPNFSGCLTLTHLSPCALLLCRPLSRCLLTPTRWTLSSQM